MDCRTNAHAQEEPRSIHGPLPQARYVGHIQGPNGANPFDQPSQPWHGLQFCIVPTSLKGTHTGYSSVLPSLRQPYHPNTISM